jgi:hypothetical protein
MFYTFNREDVNMIDRIYLSRPFIEALALLLVKTEHHSPPIGLSVG